MSAVGSAVNDRHVDPPGSLPQRTRERGGYWGNRDLGKTSVVEEEGGGPRFLWEET